MAHAADPADTTDDVGAQLVARWRESSVGERATMVERLCTDVELIARSRIATERPGLAEVELRRELARRRYGAPLADAAFARLLQPG
jgi:hypothetical protein